jgi:hypothetical protein
MISTDPARVLRIPPFLIAYLNPLLKCTIPTVQPTVIILSFLGPVTSPVSSLNSFLIKKGRPQVYLLITCFPFTKDFVSSLIGDMIVFSSFLAKSESHCDLNS